MKIKFYGVRGSIPTVLSRDEIHHKLEKILSMATPTDIKTTESIKKYISSLPVSLTSSYGGNTTCIEVVDSVGGINIIDCGTGLKQLGRDMMRTEFGKGAGVANIFMTHTHWDHIQGIPFFVPIYIVGNHFNFYSPFTDLKERIGYQQDFSHFPKELDYMQSSKEFFTLPEDSIVYINNLKITNKSMNHPGRAFGYRFEENGKVFAYTSDCEFNIDEMESIESYRPFFQDADVLVFDAQYTFEESFAKLDWGHSSASIAIDIAAKFNVKRLILFHHDPDYSDEKLDLVLANARTYLSMNRKRVGNLQVDLAYEGLDITI